MGLFDEIDPQLLQGLDMNRAAQNPGFMQKLMGLLGGGPDDPQSQGLLGLSSALLQASGPSTMPTSLGQAMGKGLEGYGQGRQQATQNQLLAGKIKAGQGSPSSVQEWQYYNSLSPEDQKRFLEMKRSQQWLNLGGEYVKPGMGGGVEERMKVTPRPDQMPAFQGAQERAKATERAAVGMEEEFAKKGVKASNMTDLINEARTHLTNASGGYLGAGLSSVKGGLGISDETTQANQKLKLIGGWMVSNVPRMEGPQSNFDVKNYREMAATVGDMTVPIEDRMAALDTLEQLQKKYSSGVVKTGTTTKKPQSGGVRKYNPQTGRIE